MQQEQAFRKQCPSFLQAGNDDFHWANEEVNPSVEPKLSFECFQQQHDSFSGVEFFSARMTELLNLENPFRFIITDLVTDIHKWYINFPYSLYMSDKNKLV